MEGWISRIFTSFIDVPGKIATAIYFSGCSLRCKGCHNKDIWEKESGKIMTDQQLMSKINDNELADHVVFLGGEPTDQLDFLVYMCKKIKKESNKAIAIYTGREFEVLPEELLDCLSMVVCGPYRQDLPTGSWPASSNQRVFKRRGNIWKN